MKSFITPAVLALIIAPQWSNAFCTPQLSCKSRPTAFHSKESFVVSMSEDDDNERQSRLEGNRREPTVQEISIMDDMITKLMNAKPYELPNAVSKAIRVVSSPQFFMRVAERADVATEEEEKEKLSVLASNLVATIEAVVSTTEDRMDERAQEVESVVKAAAEPDSGEFLVPLTRDRVEAMRDALNELDESSLDEVFLTTVDAWMNKSQQDGMDGMVTIMQKVLQIYAGTAVVRARAQLQANVGAAVSGKDQNQADEVAEVESIKPAARFLDKMLVMDTELWDYALKNDLENETDVKAKSVMAEVQKTIEGVVLGLENGSMAQRVQAEYLRELMVRIEALE